MKFEIRDIVLLKWVTVILALALLYLFFVLMSTMNENVQNKDVSLKLLERITVKNDSIVTAKNEEIAQLMVQNAESKKIVAQAEIRIDTLLATIEAKKSMYRRRKKSAGNLSGSELVNYWRNEVK
jgi:hypothetical protein